MSNMDLDDPESVVEALRSQVSEAITLYELRCYVCGTASEQGGLRRLVASDAYGAGWRINQFGKVVCGECHGSTI